MDPQEELLHYAPEGMCLFDASGLLLHRNPAAETLLGQALEPGRTTFSQVTARLIDCTLKIPKHPKTRQSFRAPQRQNVQVRTPAGAPVVVVEVLLVPLRGRPDGWRAALYLRPEAGEARQAEMYRQLMGSGMAGILSFDLTGRILEANDFFLDMLGYTREDLARGLSWLDMIQPELTNAEAIREELRKHRRVGPREIKYVRKDGSPILIAGSAALLEDGRTGLAVLTDLREQQRLEEMRKKFILTASHELRTPITSLLVYLRFLQDSQNLNEEEQELLEIASRNVKRLTELINTMLDVERLEMGPGAVKREAVDLAGIARHAAAGAEAEARPKGLRVTAHLPGDGDCQVLGDGERLEQMVTNLVGNALKYTAEGEVEIGLRRLPEGDVEFWVRDTGVGIKAEDRMRIFDGFYRAAGALKTKVPGTGLGLRIVKDVVELHNGTIRLDSEPGRGSTFTVRLPSAATEPPGASPVP